MKKFILAAMLAAFSIATIAPAFVADQAFAQEEKKKEKKEKKE